MDCGIFVRKQALFQTGDEHDVKFQPLGRVHGHQLKRILPFTRLMLTGFERGVGEKRSQRVGVVDCVRVRRILQEIGCGADQFVELVLMFATGNMIGEAVVMR